jgi:hypothetical protein
MRLGTEPGAERPGQTPTIQGCNRTAVTASTLSDETIVGSVASLPFRIALYFSVFA